MNMNNDFFNRDANVARINATGDVNENAHGLPRDTIRENAMGPKKVTGDSGSMEQHSLQDQIAADKYLASKEAVRRGIGIKTVKILPDGTT